MTPTNRCYYCPERATVVLHGIPMCETHRSKVPKESKEERKTEPAKCHHPWCECGLLDCNFEIKWGNAL